MAAVVQDMTEQRPGAVTAAVRVAGAAIALDGLAEPTRVDMHVWPRWRRCRRSRLRMTSNEMRIDDLTLS